MIHRANIPDEHRHLLFGTAVEKATHFDAFLIIGGHDGAEKTRVERATSNLPTYTKNLGTWGEAGVV